METCPACGARTPDGARFCTECGASLAATCETCGAELPEGARFCPACGAAVQSAARPPAGFERKLVTVLFADIAGSTGLGERLDPEQVTEVVGAFFEAMREEIEAEGGTVEKYVGDAVMAVFGVPVAHEDDPARAIRAALRMQQRLEEVNAESERRYGVSLAIRIGVNTGEVLAATAPAPGEALATGDTVNVAARLEQGAEPGQIVVGERTARNARGFRYRELGPLELRGRTAPLRAFLVTGTAPAERAGAVLRAPMVGRRRELALLRTVVERAASERRPHLVTIYGEPGVGKSRLVAELLAEVERLEPAPAIDRGRCLPYGDGVTYWPLAEILKRRAGVQDSDPPDVVLERVRALGRDLLGAFAGTDARRLTAALAYTIGVEDPEFPFEDLTPRQVRAGMHAAWRAFFSASALAGPLVAVVEDIHWADPALLDLIEDVVERAAGPIVLVCPARPELAERRPGWGGARANSSSVVLEPLPRDDAERLVGLLLPVDDLPSSLRERILERAEGNPFFLEEILHQLVDEGVLVHEDGRWRCTRAPATVSIPDTVQAVLAARIDLLEPAEKRVLQRAAVVGRAFWPGPLERLLDGDAEMLTAALDRLEERDLVELRLSSAIGGQPEYAFKHALVRDVAYESLPRRERPAAHAAVARWIAETAGERRREFVELLAYHYLEAYRGGEGADAEEYRRHAFEHLLHASVDARSKLALDKARHLANQAVDVAVGATERALALEALGEAHHADYRGDEAWRALRAAADELLASSDADGRAVASICARALELPTRFPGTMRELPPPEEVRRYLDAGLARIGPEDSVERVRLLTAVSMLPFGFFYQGVSEEELDAARRAGEEAVEMALRLDEPALASAALDGLASVFTIRGDYGAMLGAEERRLELVPRLHDSAELGDLHALVACGYFHVGRYRESARVAARGFELSIADTPAFGLHCLTWEVMGLFRLGGWEAALARHRQLESILGDRWRDPPRPYLRAAAAVAFMREARGERSEADRQLELLRSIEDVQKTRSATGPSWVALTLARRGAFDEAREWLERLRWPEGLALKLEALCDLVAAEGAWEEAEELVARAREHATRTGLEALPCFADRLEGRAALAAGDAELAVRSLARARDAFARLGARWERACTELSLGEALAAAGRPEEARAAAESALAVFEDVSSRRERDLASALLA